MIDAVADETPAPPKRKGRPPKAKPVADSYDLATKHDVGPDDPIWQGGDPSKDTINMAVVYVDAIAVVQRYRAEVANFETLDDARKFYALDVLDRLLKDLGG